MKALSRIKKELESGSDSRNYNYLALGLVGASTHIIFFIYWTYIEPQHYESLYLRGIGFLSNTILLSTFLWPSNLDKIKNSYWVVTIIYNLPFFFVTYLIKNKFSDVWLVGQTVAIFVTIFFLPKISHSITVLFSGTWLAILFCIMSGVPSDLNHHVALYQHIPVYILVFMAAQIFTYSNNMGLSVSQACKDQRTYLMSRSLAGSIAHEMRNPLSQIHGSLYLVEELQKQSPYDENPFVAEHIKNAQKAIHSGIQMIDMTMDAINEKPIDRSSFIILSAQAIVKETVKDYAYADADHINRITIEGDDFQLLADPIMVKYVLYNLIQNAFWYIKNSHGGKLVISIFSNTNGFHCIEVRDNGPGIAPEAIPKLFDPFYTTDKRGGTGLGLSYCKRTMMALGGEIECHSNLGLYTAFVLSFPILGARQIDDCAEHEQDTESDLLTGSVKETVTVAAEPPAYLVGKTVLLVEDERTIRAVIKALLEQYGMHCVEAENGQEAVALFSTIDCALIITDLHMPVMNGVDLIKAIRELEAITANSDRGESVPIVIITSEKGSLLSSAIQAGANTFLAKPVADDKLKSTLHRLYAKSIKPDW